MKLNIYLFLVCLFCFSCGGNPCEELNCGEHGTCNEETESCVCDQYYEGELCTTETRSVFLKDWIGTGECDYNLGNLFDLNVNISPGLAVNEIKIQSTQILQEFTITGTLDENNNIVIPVFMPHIGSNTHDGEIMFDSADNSLVMTLNAYVGDVKSFCVYRLK